MKILEQVCTRQQGEKLCSLGVPKHAIFLYTNIANVPFYHTYGIGGSNCEPLTESIPAFTSTELGDIILRKICSDFGNTAAIGNFISTDNHERGSSDLFPHFCGEWSLPNWIYEKLPDIKLEWFESEAKARAALLILMLENKLVS